MQKRLLTVVQMLPNLEEGGVECETVELAGYLTGKGHRSIVISEGGRMVPMLTSSGSVHLTWPYIGKKSPHCLKHLLPLRRLLIDYHVDVLHLHSRLPAWVGYLAWKSLPRKNRPHLITTFHGFYSVNAYSAVMTKGEGVIAVSKHIADHISATYGLPADTINIIYGGFDENRFDPAQVGEERLDALRMQWGIPLPDVPIILLPGRITRLKGHKLFIQGLAGMQNLPWMAVCIGDLTQNPGLTHELQKQVSALGLTDRVHFAGYCEDMPAALKLARVVVSSSIKPESFGRTIVEAQAMGTPVIAAAHGGSLETVLDGVTGWLIQPGNAAEMAKTLAEAVTNEDLCTRMGQSARDWVDRQFTARKMFAQTLAVYESFAHNSNEINKTAAHRLMVWPHQSGS